MPRPVRLLIVDDSQFVQASLKRKLGSTPEIEIVGTAGDGIEAIDRVHELRPDVVTLDVEMPRMDGLAALEHIMRTRPTPVVMLSSLTGEGADATLRALELGAIDFFLKPSQASPTGLDREATDLRAKILGAARANPARLGPVRRTAAATARVRRSPGTHGAGMSNVLVVGSSTGGPRALMELLPALPGDLPAGVLIVQHMPPGFTRSMAERLDALSALHIKEASPGDVVRAGQGLIAAGGYHLVVDRRGRIDLTLDDPEHGVRPAVDVTMEAVARVYGDRSLGVVLTGMGSDGTRGAALIRAAGGRVAAEDESTCAVYGMPRSVIEAGHGDVVAPLQEMPRTIRAMCGMREPVTRTAS
ncbi:MAG: chemotaxis response regulator protein-glutamate methylesterase [Dehalococcoidia bacterium]